MNIPNTRQLGFLFVGAVLLISAFFLTNPLSIVEDTQKDEITFTMYSEDMREGRFDPGTPTNYASLDGLEIETSNLGMEGFYFYACYEDVEITENGQTLFDEQVQDALPNNEGIEDENLDDFITPEGYEIDIERVRYSTITEEFWDGWDTVVDDCLGSTISVTKPVDFEDVDVEVQVDEERDLEDRVTADLVVDNQWQDLEINAEAEVCIDEDFCQTEETEGIQVSEGSNEEITILDREGIGANVTVDVQGDILWEVPGDISGLNYGGEDVSQVDSIRIAEFESGEVSEFDGQEVGTDTEQVIIQPEPVKNEEAPIRNRLASILQMLPFIDGGDEQGEE